MSEKLKIFISSPVKGLFEEREALIKALKEKYKPEAMELWVSSPDHPKNLCLEKVRTSDALILLSGPYYGSIDAISGKSFTELEYDEADSYGIDVFHFYKVNQKGESFRSAEVAEETRKKHESFYERIWQFRGPGFADATEVSNQVLQALEQYSTKKQERLRPFVDAKEYFKDFLKKGYFRHDYKLVGRQDILNSLKAFVESEKKVFVLFGRGGLGKSKIVYEFAHNRDSYVNKKWKHVLFLREIFDINQNTLQNLPAHPIILILDDAHRYEDLDLLLSIFKGSPLGDRIKLILSARPLGREKINYSLSRNIPYESVATYDLDDLDDDDVNKLARNLLSNKSPQIISMVSNMTKDCPLATIVACNLINEGLIHPDAIPQKEEFQKIIFDRFLEEYKGKDLADSITQRLLDYISVLSPLIPTDKKFREKISDILSVSISDISRRIAILEERGLLLRKGRLVKIVPDLLSDYILFKACVDINNSSTNFVEEVLEIFHEDYLKNILFNVSEVEWRARLSSKKLDLLGNIWDRIKNDFKSATVYNRTKILEEIEKAAAFQPAHVLDIVNIAMNELPAKVKQDDDPIFAMLDWSNDRVLEKLPRVLRRVAYNIEYFDKSCDILWNLGKQDTRELNPYPESPLRVLMDLAEYGIRKPIAYNKRMLECIKRWLNQKDAYSYRYSPLDILVKLLAKEGEDTEFRVDKFIMRGFPLNFKVIDNLRIESLTILKEHVTTQKPKHIIFRALDLLIDTLRRPPMLFGRKTSKEEDEYIEQEQLRILDIIKEAIPKLNSEALNTIIKKDLRWYQLHGRTENLKGAVANIIESIKENDLFRIYRALIGNFREFLDHEHNWEKQSQIIEEETIAVAEIILNNYKTPNGIFNFINTSLKDILEYKLSVNPSHVLSQIAKKNSEIALNISSLIVDNPDEEMAKNFASLIWPLKLDNKNNALIDAIISKAIEKGDYWPCLNIAHSFSWGVNQYTEFDYINIRKLLAFNQKEITKTLIHSLSKIGQQNSVIAFEMALLIDLLKMPEIADDFCSIFNEQYGISLNNLENKHIETILDKLLPIHLFKGQHYHIDKFLEYVSNRSPDSIVLFLLQRMEYSRKEEIRSRDYAPLPYLGFNYNFFDPSKIKNASKYIRIIRDLALNPENMDTFWLPKLFQIVSNSYAQEALNVLAEWLESRDAKNVEALSLLLREANQGFLFGNYKFVGDLLYSAANISEECLKRVKSNLFGIAVSGGSTRSHGQPSQKNVDLKNKGEETSQLFNPPHPAYYFYQEISGYGAAEIKEELARDQELEYE